MVKQGNVADLATLVSCPHQFGDSLDRMSAQPAGVDRGARPCLWPLTALCRGSDVGHGCRPHCRVPGARADGAKSVLANPQTGERATRGPRPALSPAPTSVPGFASFTICTHPKTKKKKKKTTSHPPVFFSSLCYNF